MFGDFLARTSEFLYRGNQSLMEVVLFGTWFVVGYVFILPDYDIVGLTAFPYAIGIGLIPVALLKIAVAVFVLLFEFSLRSSPVTATLEMPLEKARARLVRAFVDRGITYRSLEEWSLGPVGRAIAKPFKFLAKPSNTYFCREPFVVVQVRDVSSPRGPETFIALDYESTPRALTLARYFEGMIKYK